jgi:hypothetical protein
VACTPVGVSGRRGLPREDPPMADLVFVALTIAFFAASWLYVRACERM